MDADTLSALFFDITKAPYDHQVAFWKITICSILTTTKNEIHNIDKEQSF
jgi:hypothetical protein